MALYTFDDWSHDTKRVRRGLLIDCPICGADVDFRGSGVLCGECKELPMFRVGPLTPPRFIARVNAARADRHAARVDRHARTRS